jgi:hypothetical protein
MSGRTRITHLVSRLTLTTRILPSYVFPFDFDGLMPELYNIPIQKHLWGQLTSKLPLLGCESATWLADPATSINITTRLHPNTGETLHHLQAVANPNMEYGFGITSTHFEKQALSFGIFLGFQYYQMLGVEELLRHAGAEGDSRYLLLGLCTELHHHRLRETVEKILDICTRVNGAMTNVLLSKEVVGENGRRAEFTADLMNEVRENRVQSMTVEEEVRTTRQLLSSVSPWDDGGDDAGKSNAARGSDKKYRRRFESILLRLETLANLMRNSAERLSYSADIVRPSNHA